MVATSDPGNCGANDVFMQNTVGTTPDLTPSYDVPGDGVITSWSTKPIAGDGSQAQLMVYRPSGDPATWTLVGVSPVKVLTGDALNTFSVRIPVQADDRIAIRTGDDGGPCTFGDPAALGPDYHVWFFSIDPATPDPPVGSDVVFTDFGIVGLVNVAAVVEPDADGDGFGDETQDQCPGVAGTSNGCQPPAPPVVVPPPIQPQPPVPPTPPPPLLHVTAAARHTQHVLKQRGVVLTVRPNVASKVTGTATISLPNGSKLLRFKRATKHAAANAKVTLKLTLSRAQLRRVKAALRHHKLTAKAVLTTTASGQKPSVKRISIRLKP